MMMLSDLQIDALAEVFNVGAGRAAASLSEIVGDEVLLSVPRLAFYARHELTADTLNLTGDRLGAVQQTFSGPFNIQASLLFRQDKALEIVQEMIGSHVSVEDLVDYEQEAMSEVGNIILNACMSAVADMLAISLESTLPAYQVGATDALIAGLMAVEDQPVILVLHIDLTIEKRETKGYLVFLLSSTSFETLVTSIDDFLSRI